LILVYSKKLKVARKNGYGLYLEGDNGVGKTMFMSYVLVEAVRYGYSAYYSTTSDLEHTMQQGFSDRAIAERMEEMLWSDFFGLDELGGEQVKAGSTWAKMQVERVLKFRLDNRLPTVVATNSSTRKILNCYGPSVSSVLNGNSYQRVLFENGDCRKEGREKMRSEIGYKK
jgi:DNA replication protein DnaC